jgi:D-alanyl-D-alanine carboxypeptidase
MSGGWGGFGAAGLSLAVGLWGVGAGCGGSGGGADVVTADGVVFYDLAPDADVAAAPALAPATVAALEAAVDEGFEAVEAPGVQVTVVAPGHGTWSRDEGLATAEPPAPLAPGDRFRVGSVTKIFNAAAILQLVAEGALGLDDPADQWLVGFDFGPGVTIRRLLNHTAGLFNYTDDANFLGRSTAPATPTEVIAWARDHGQVFEPGADWSYSNTGYYVTGMILEAVEGAPLAEVLRRRLLGPLGLDDTFLESFEPMPGGRVTGHLLGSSAEGLLDVSWSWAAGAMVSNGADLCRWLDAVYRADVLPAALREAMVTPTALPGGGAAGYGLGTYIVTRGGVSLVGHTGSTMGFRGEVFMHLESGTCVAVLSNDFFASPRGLADLVWAALARELGLSALEPGD